MKKAKFDAIRKKAWAFCDEAYRGSRVQEEKREKMVIDWVRANCSEKPKSAAYVVYTFTKNLGTKKYYHGIDAVLCESVGRITGETEKSLMAGHTRISKAKIIGWLTE